MPGVLEHQIPYSGGVLRGVGRSSRQVLLLLLAASALLGCGQQAIRPPSGPQATPSPDRATAVIQRSCATTPKADILARDVTFMQNVLLRQQAQLQRVADDISGAVPGGNLANDTQLAQANARQLVDLVLLSTLCSPFKGRLLAAARELAAADDALVQAASGGDAGAAVQAAQARFQALKTITDTPPAA